MMIRLIPALGAGILLLVSMVIVSAAPATAGITLLSCTGSYHTTYDPGLTYTPQTVEFSTTNNYTICLLSPPITSGQSQASGPIPSASCTDLFSGGDSGQTTVTWNTGETTTYNWTALAEEIGGNLVDTETGHVVSGKFAGDLVVRTSVTSISMIENGCSTPQGLQDQTGTVTLLISG
jgi:hypothetical protein